MVLRWNDYVSFFFFFFWSAFVLGKTTYSNYCVSSQSSFSIPLTTHTNQNKHIHLNLIKNSISRFSNLFLGLDNLVTEFQNVGHWIWSRLSNLPPIHLNRTIESNIWVTNCNLILASKHKTQMGYKPNFKVSSSNHHSYRPKWTIIGMSYELQIVLQVSSLNNHPYTFKWIKTKCPHEL